MSSFVFNATIRQCKPGDERALSLIAQATILETYAALVRGRNLYDYISQTLDAETFRTNLTDGSMRLWAAELDSTGCIVGYAHAVPEANDEFAMELKRIYLLRKFKGEGIGKRLMDASLAFAREAQSQAMVLRVHHKNEEAIGFYQGYGFRAVSEESFPAGGEMSTVVVMRLNLPPEL
jgi:ribosomal protein S18 acetylase RimI-like enzyme